MLQFRGPFTVLSDYPSAFDLWYGVDYIWEGEWEHHNLQSRMLQIVMMKSKFPITIREAIANAQGLSPEQFFDCVHEAVLNLFHLAPCSLSTQRGREVFVPKNNMRGLDYNVDTEEEVEYTMRVFPDVLDDASYEHKILRNNWNAWMPKTLEALPFHPLVSGLIRDMIGDPYSVRETICACQKFCHREKSKISDARGIAKALNETLVRVKKSFHNAYSDENYGFKTICEAADFIYFQANPAGAFKFKSYSCDAMLFQFLLDWKPKMFEAYVETEISGISSPCPFLHVFLEKCRLCTKEDKWARFKAIFEGGMFHYPKQLGFLFHKSSVYPTLPQRNKHFEAACDFFGAERMAKLVEQNLLKITKARPYAIQALFVSALCNPTIDADGIFSILRLHPTALVSTQIKAVDSSTNEQTNPDAKDFTPIERDAVFQLMRLHSDPGSVASKTVPNFPITQLPASFELVSSGVLY